MVSENVIDFKIAPWEGPACANLFLKIQKWTFLNPNVGGLFRGLFWGGWVGEVVEITACLKPVRIMLEI